MDKLHTWLNKNYGKADHCDNPNCNCKNIKKYDWAMIHEKGYDYDVNNFMQLCRSCHLKYDYTEETKKKISIKMTGNEKLKKSLKGNKNGLGHKHTPEELKKMSSPWSEERKLKFTGRKLSIKHKESIKNNWIKRKIKYGKSGRKLVVA